AYRFENGTQIKYYTVDTLDKNGKPDTSNTTSLKTADGSGPLMRTLPSTLNFETGSSYIVEFDYQSYRETRKKGAVDKDVQGNPISEAYTGYNYVLANPAYQLVVHKADGTVISTHELTPSTFAEGTDISKFSFNSRPSTRTAKVEVDAKNEERYLSDN
ncbi:hypothetical protein EVA_17670, partial [gut metagenome]